MSPEERREAYECDVTYATPNEVGFDFLRDQLALIREELTLPRVQRRAGRRSRFDPDRRSSHSAGDRRRATPKRKIWRETMAAAGAEMTPGRDFISTNSSAT